MAKHDYCLIWLTCGNQEEADKIADTLLAKHLVACVKSLPVESGYRWKDKIERTKEVWLWMESRLELFNEIEAEVNKLHSYETFVLEATLVKKISKEAADWLSKETSSSQEKGK